MKYFIYAIAVIHLGCSTSLGEETGFDRQLPAPDSIHIRGQMGEKSKKLKEFLKSGNFKQFYGCSNTVLSELNAMRRHGTMTREEACDMIWSLYLISGAPMYEAPDYDSTQPWPEAPGYSLLFSSSASFPRSPSWIRNRCRATWASTNNG